MTRRKPKTGKTAGADKSTVDKPTTGGTTPDGESGTTQDPLALAVAFVQLFCEVESGRRPRATVTPLMTERLAAQLAPFWVRDGRMRRPGAARGGYTAPDVYEAVVVTHGRDRRGAVAVRLERRASGWRVTEAGRPEDGPLPEPVSLLPAVEPCAFELCCRWLDGGAPISAREPAAAGPVHAAVGL